MKDAIKIAGIFCALIFAMWISGGVSPKRTCIAGSVEALFTSCDTSQSSRAAPPR